MDAVSISRRSFVSSDFSTPALTSDENATLRANDDEIQLHALLSRAQGGQEVLRGPYTRKPANALEKTREYLTVFLRNIHLLCLEAIGPWRKTQETPKVAVYKGRMSALLGLPIHIIPLAATLSLIVLNIRTKFAGNGDSEVPLQFLAKFLELFAQASICNIVFTYVRLQLIGQRPFPFGAMFAGLSVTHLSYLWSPEFLGSVTSSSLASYQRLAVCLFIPFNILLAAGIGPSIAIALIPRPQLFPAGMTYTWMNATPESLFPMHVTLDHVHPTCLDPRTHEPSPDRISCPFSNWESVVAIRGPFGWTAPGMLQHDFALPRELRNVYMSQLPDTQLPPGSRPSTLRSTNDRSYVGISIPSLPISQELVRVLTWWSVAVAIIKDGSYRKSLGTALLTLEAKQPISWVTCEPGKWSPLSDKVTFQLGDWSKYPAVENKTVSAPELKTLSPESPRWQIAWVDSEPTIANYSALALILPPWTTGKSSPSGALAEDLQYDARVCLVSAGWANSTLSIQVAPSLRDNRTFTITSNITSIPTRTEDLVTITKDWAKLLTPTFQDFNISVLDVLMSSFGEGYIEQALAISVINGMSQINFDEPGYFNSLFEASPKEVTEDWIFGFLTGTSGTNIFNASQSVKETNYRTTFRAFFYDTAYSTEGISIKVALAVLFIYCTYITAFIIYTLGFSNHHASGAWDSIAEVTALAMLSQPTEKLQHTSAGIETVQVFRKPVNVRAAGYDHLELVFGNDSANRPSDTVRENKEY